MKNSQLNDIELMKLINKHPNIKAQIEAMLLVANASVDGLTKARDVEMKVRDGVRDIGKNIIENWAINSEEKLAVEAAKNEQLKKHSKKNSTGIQPLDQ